MVAIAIIDEVELLVCPVQEITGQKGRQIVFFEKRDMGGRDADLFGHLGEAGGKKRFKARFVHRFGNEQAWPGCRREGHRALQLRIIVAAGPLESIRPAVVEDVFALAVVFQIGRHCADEHTGGIFEKKMVAKPAGLGCR
ncbi:hypothetical protein D3C78_1207560 [compost metagenome]